MSTLAPSEQQDFAEQLRHVVQTAGLAPSVHNSQPWRFVARPAGLELWAEPGRQLAVLDPDGRQLHVSCGAALFHARTSARALGLDAEVHLLPDAQRPELLAELLLSTGLPPSADDVLLARAIAHRHTFRGGFAGGGVSETLIDRLRRAAESEGAVLNQVVRREALLELGVLLSHADSDEEQDAGYRQELQSWLRTDPSAPDGLPQAPAAQNAAGSSLRQRDFTFSHSGAMDGSAPPADRPVVLVLTTDQDDPTAWLQAGQALAAVLLRAADQDVQAQPLGQVTDSSAYRVRLRSVLALVGFPQLVLRMGSAPAAVAATPRRDVDDVLVPLPPEAVTG